MINFAEIIGEKPQKLNTMEEKIYQKLIAGLKNSPLSDRTIRSKAQRMAKKITTDEQLTDDVITDAIEDLKELGGQINKEVADKVKEQAEKLKSSTPTTPPAPQAPITDPALAARIEAMEAKLKESEMALLKQRVKEEAKALLKAQHADKDYILKNVLARVEIAEGDTAETLAAKCIPLYDKEYKEAYGEGATPRVPQGEDGVDTAAAKAKLLEFKKTKEGRK